MAVLVFAHLHLVWRGILQIVSLTYCSSLYELLKGVSHRCQFVTRKLGTDDTDIG